MPITQYGQQVVWGTRGISAQYGVLTAYTEGSACDKTPNEDEDGETVGVSVYNRRKTVNAQWTAKSDAQIPEAGDRVTIGRLTIIVDTAEKGRTNKGAMTIRITGTKYNAF